MRRRTGQEKKAANAAEARIDVDKSWRSSFERRRIALRGQPPGHKSSSIRRHNVPSLEVETWPAYTRRPRSVCLTPAEVEEVRDFLDRWLMMVGRRVSIIELAKEKRRRADDDAARS